MADTAITLASTYKSPLNLATDAQIGYNTKFSIPYTLVAASTTGSTDTVTFTLGLTPTNWYIDKAVAVVSTAFAGTTGGLAVIVGTTASTNAIIASTSVLTAATIPQASTVPVLTNLKGTSATTLTAIFTNSVSGSPSGVTAGQLDIYMHIVDVNRIG